MTILIVILGINLSYKKALQCSKKLQCNNRFYGAGKMFYSAVKVLQKVLQCVKLFYKAVKDLTVW